MKKNSTNPWILTKKFNKKYPGHFETVFTLANKYTGMRGYFGFSPFACEPGYYMAGLFNKTPYFKSEPVNIPAPFNYALIIKGEKADIMKNRIISATHTLDMKRGVLINEAVVMDRKKNRTSIKEERFLHIKYKELAVQRVTITPLNYSGSGFIMNTLDL